LCALIQDVLAAEDIDVLVAHDAEEALGILARA
jgi:hypothetical protein